MSTPKPRIAIVGLGQVGRSIGLALHQAEVASAVVGHDRDRRVANEAKAKGAVDSVEWNLISTIEKADMVILAEPIDGLEATLQAIGPYLRPGCVVMDTVALKGPVLAWAAQHLPSQVHFVGTNPILPAQVAPGDARADLFERGLFCVVPSAAAEESSVKLVTDLVNILGAQPLFLDAAEHDGLLAGIDQLPLVSALALVEMAAAQPTWRELRKLGGPAFAAGTHLGEESPAALSLAFLANRENMVRWIDAYVAALGSIREAMARGQGEELAQRLDKALKERQKWLADQGQGQWQEGPRVDMPRTSFLDTFLGTFWRKGTKREP